MDGDQVGKWDRWGSGWWDRWGSGRLWSGGMLECGAVGISDGAHMVIASNGRIETKSIQNQLVK